MYFMLNNWIMISYMYINQHYYYVKYCLSIFLIHHIRSLFLRDTIQMSSTLYTPRWTWLVLG